MSNKNISNKHSTFKGYVLWQVINSDGSIALEGEHENLILDAGLNLLATTIISGVFTSICIGTGNTEPANSQTGLVAEIARTSTYITTAGACTTTQTNNVIVHQRTFTFPIAAINTTIYEVGFSNIATAGANLFSRSLFKDGGGNPVGISVLSTQSLRIVYKLTFTYGSLAWETGTFNVTNVGTITYKHKTWDISNAYSYVSSAGAAVSPGGSLVYNTVIEPCCNTGVISPGATFYTGPANVSYPDETYVGSNTVPLNTLPGAGGDTAKLWTKSTYVNGNFYYDRTITFGLNDAVNGIKWIYIGGAYTEALAYSNYPYYLNTPMPILDIFYLQTNIPKTSAHTLSLTLRQSWGRG